MNYWTVILVNENFVSAMRFCHRETIIKCTIISSLPGYSVLEISFFKLNQLIWYSASSHMRAEIGSLSETTCYFRMDRVQKSSKANCNMTSSEIIII
jgi:hypothetical protein